MANGGYLLLEPTANPVNLRDWKGAFVIPDALPGIPYGDGRRIWTPAFTCYQGALEVWQDRILAVFLDRGYTHLPYNCAGSIYHNDYPDMSDDTARTRRDLLKIQRAGAVAVVCACDDQNGGNVVPWRAFTENADLIHIAFPMWEMNGPLGNATYNSEWAADRTFPFSGRIVDCIRNTRAAAPKAETYLHFTAGHGSIGTPEREGWAFVKSLGVLGLLSQDNGYDRDAYTGDPVGTAAGLADTAMRLGTLGLLNVAFEQCTYPTYLHWDGWDEAHQRAYGMHLRQHGGAIAGFCDGATL